MFKNLTIFVLATALLFGSSVIAAPKAFVDSQNRLHVDGKVTEESFLSQRGTNFDLDGVFDRDPQAKEVAEKYMNARRWYYIGSGIFWTGFLAVIMTGGPEALYYAELGVVVGGAIMMGVSNDKMNSRLRKAINIYNGVSPEIADGSGQSHMSFGVALEPRSKMPLLSAALSF